MPRPRVLIATPDFPPAAGGIQLLVARVAAHLERLEPIVVCPGAPDAGRYDSALSHPVHRVRAWSGQPRETILRLNSQVVRVAKRTRPALVVSAHIVTAPGAVTVRKTLGIPYVQYLHGVEATDRPRLAAFAGTRADLVIAVSEATRQIALDLGIRPERIVVIPPGVDPARARREPQAEEPLVVTVARLAERYKGHDVMTRAFPLVRTKVPGARWIVVGDGPLRPWLEELRSSRGLEEAIQYTGSVTDAERDDWLDRAWVFAMPSRLSAGGAGEGFGIVYMEAASRGLPAVAGNVGGALDAIDDGQTGLLVDPTSHLDVADALAGLLADPGRAQQLGKAGLVRAEGFQWSRIAARIEDALERAAGLPAG